MIKKIIKGRKIIIKRNNKKYLSQRERRAIFQKEKQARLTYIIIQSNFKDEEKNIKDNNYSERKIYKFNNKKYNDRVYL